MEFRVARIEDLKQLKIIYKEIIKNMNKFIACIPLHLLQD